MSVEDMPLAASEIWRKVIIPLLAIAENDEAAIIGEHAGFTDFLSYEEAANVDFQEIWRKVIIPLLAIAENDEAAIIGEHAGFTDFLSYEEAANVDFQLNLVDAATGLCAPGSARNYSDPMQGCAKCEKGRFNNDGLPVCHACEPGFYGDETGLLEQLKVHKA
eukprot:g10136.t1